MCNYMIVRLHRAPVSSKYELWESLEWDTRRNKSTRIKYRKYPPEIKIHVTKRLKTLNKIVYSLDPQISLRV